jgi:ribosomal protein S18 acetylase RimI-like enzyme
MENPPVSFGDIEFSAAEFADLQTILELQYLAYQSEAALHNTPSIPPLLETFGELEQEYNDGVVLKAVAANGVIIGSVRGYVKDGTVFVGKLMVHPEYRGRGIGSRLLAEIEKHCPQARYELFTSDKSVRNLSLYERLGYVRFAERQVSPDLRFVYLEKMCMET